MTGIDTHGFPNLSIEGRSFRAKSVSEEGASFLFQETPVLNLPYKMLYTDLKAHYNVKPLWGM